jgi:hypothetical protein
MSWIMAPSALGPGATAELALEFFLPTSELSTWEAASGRQRTTAGGHSPIDLGLPREERKVLR